MLLKQEKGTFKMPKKLKFSKEVSPQFLSKTRTSYHLCFLGKQATKKSFLEILD